jgi:hypothetical protein
MDEKIRQAQALARAGSKNIEEAEAIDSFNNLTFDYAGNAMIMKEVNRVIESVRPQGFVENAFKILKPLALKPPEGTSKSVEPRKRLVLPQKLNHPYNVL